MEISKQNPNPSKMDGHRKKIFFLITKSNWGGAQKYVYDLATSFGKEDFEVVVALGGEGELKNKLNEKNIKTITIERLSRDISILDEFKVFFDLIKIFKEESPDVVHLNSSKIGGLGSLAGRIAGVKKIVFTAHGLAFNEDRPSWQKWIIKLITYLTFIFSHKTIVISKREQKQIKGWFFIKKKIRLIYNGVSKIDFLERKEAREFLISKIPAIKRPKNIEDILWVGTISELTKNKGLGYAIKAIKKLEKNLHHDWKGIFVIIGSGEERGYLEDKIRKYKLENKVFLTGFIDAKEYLKAFDIFLLSSVKEGLPYVLLEAGLAKNSVISTDVGGIKEIIDDIENGLLIRPKDKKEIANALQFYIENPEKINSFGESLSHKVKEKFSMTKMIKKTKELYFS